MSRYAVSTKGSSGVPTKGVRLLPPVKKPPAKAAATPPPLNTSGLTASAIKENADRLGLTWRMRPATVASSNKSAYGNPAIEGVPVIYDGDSAVLQAVSLIGLTPTGTRVMCIQIPPQGNYIVGVINGSVPRNLIFQQQVFASGSLALTTTPTNIPGASVSVDIKGSWAYEVNAIFHAGCSLAANSVVVGQLVLPDSTVPGNVAIGISPTELWGFTIAQNWYGTMDSQSGSSTFQLQAWKTVAAGTFNCGGGNTSLIVKIYQ